MKNLFTKLLSLFILIMSVSGSAYAWGVRNPDPTDPTYGEEYGDEEAPQKYTQVAAQHILVRNAADAVSIKKELDNGGSFEYYAKKYSICPSARNGGYLGYFERGQMVPEFEKRAFSMKIGEISSPVRTDFGWHLIRVVDKR